MLAGAVGEGTAVKEIYNDSAIIVYILNPNLPCDLFLLGRFEQ